MPNTITLNKHHIILAFLIISLASSIVLSTQPLSEICDVGKGCEVVQHSKYSETLGIKNSHFGVLIFAILSIITFKQIKLPTKKKKQFLKLGLIIGSIIAIYFIYLQQFILKAYCKYCMVVDISILIALAILLTWKK